MSKTVLVVDDDVDVQEVVGISLKGAGYRVLTAGDGEKALEILENDDADVVILDVMMAQPDEGFYVAQRIKSSDQPIPIIMLTSVSQATGWDYEIDEEMVPVERFLEKPIKPETLLRTVEEVLTGEVGV
ncbi:MAG: response regulator transcription factor [Clostridia bacterium]